MNATTRLGRILSDIRANRCGLPDLVQFWPAERRYRLIEVKGPGDRLQDNQIRWLTFCVAQGIPVSVCHVTWLTADSLPTDAHSPLAGMSGVASTTLTDVVDARRGAPAEAEVPGWATRVRI